MDDNAAGQESVEIRAALAADLPEIGTVLAGSPEAARWSARALRELLDTAKDTFLVARMGKEMAGFIVGRAIGDEAEILNMAVRRDRRRRGVGKVLALALLENYTRAGAVRTFLEVRESNGGAIAFYEALGFQEVGRRPDYYRDPVEAALILSRQTDVAR
jgi:ribosomal-protein-alanine N-acetyltransferase